MTRAARLRGAAALIAGGALLAACTSGAEGGATPSTAVPSSPAAPSESPSPSATVVTPPPLAPGTARGRLVVVQQAEDAALVSGGKPIRLTLARTGNSASWFTSPPEKLAGTMSTEEALRTLGWRPSPDGTTAPLPAPRPNGLLAYAGGSLPFTVQRASVRADGTLVLDVRPIGATPETVESYGPVSLTLDGAPGVLDLTSTVGGLTVRVIVTGERNEQAVVQVIDDAGEVVESGFVSPEEPAIDRWLDMASGSTAWADPGVAFTPPVQGRPGVVRVTGVLTVDGLTTALDQVVARWSLPVG